MSLIKTAEKSFGQYDKSIQQQELEYTGELSAEDTPAQIRVWHRCGGCGKKQEFLNSGKFRVNANGNNVDVWLIYRCKKCKHSWNLSIYERTRPSKIPRGLFEAFQDNDAETALAYGRNVEFLKKNHAELCGPQRGQSARPLRC